MQDTDVNWFGLKIYLHIDNLLQREKNSYETLQFERIWIPATEWEFPCKPNIFFYYTPQESTSHLNDF